jgi:hypothetical protein
MDQFSSPNISHPQTIVRGELVTVHSVDGIRWFSRKRDLRRFREEEDQAGQDLGF